MKQIKIAGVPEHFNLPWHLCIENKEFQEVGIDLQWIDVPEGTGKICQMLRDGSTDIAIILTEGILKDLSQVNHSTILQMYVESPLLWGIHVDYKSNYHKIEDLKNTKAAISRLGSGSHLMSYVNAQNQGWDLTELEFEIVNTFQGGIDSLLAKTSDYFMWEQFMTQPKVDDQTLRKVATCPTPWPCFVIAVRTNFLHENEKDVKQLLQIINSKTKIFKKIPNIDVILATKYNQKLTDSKEWLNVTHWSQKQMTSNVFDKIQNQLFELKIIDKKCTFATVFAEI
jgi:ABC-type nitrate/sulfonate/bicarbonate transport system substrate-binding protein